MPTPLTICIAVLAAGQAVSGIVTGVSWVKMGTDWFGQGVLILPAAGIVASLIGGLVIITALLYVLFAVGILATQDWARPLGIIAISVNGLLAVGGAIREGVIRSAAWMVVPAIIMGYLLYRSEIQLPPIAK